MVEEPIKRLYRSRNERLLGGICGGLAEYFRVDPTIMRLIYILLCFVSLGSGVLIYIVLWLIVPEKGSGALGNDGQDKSDTSS
jgi:phage shock protein PspC (stress-responsive transcriptional regulator)